MGAAKVAITIEEELLKRVDQLVEQRRFPNRSRAIQEAVREKLDRLDRGRLEATSIQAVQLLAHRLLDRATPIRKPPLFDELVDALQQLFLNCDRNFRGAHWPNPRWYDLFSYQGPCHMTTALGPHAPRRPAPGPEAGGRRRRAPQPRAPDAGSGEAEQTSPSLVKERHLLRS